MNHHKFSLSNQQLWALPNGALWWPAHKVLVVSDLHLGKSERLARRGGALLPPFETTDTLTRLQDCIVALGPDIVISLGDSFDDASAAATLDETERLWITKLQAGREWIWIAGNHDPAPLPYAGAQLAQWQRDTLVFRHIALADATGEISGHYHPKASIGAGGRRFSRPCFLVDDTRVIMPAFGTYTGGLRCTDPVLADLMNPKTMAIMTGDVALAVPMPRRQR